MIIGPLNSDAKQDLTETHSLRIFDVIGDSALCYYCEPLGSGGLEMQVRLSKQEIAEIEMHIDQIDCALDVLDPSNAIEAQEIERKTHVLRSYIALLENSSRKAVSHLRLVS